MTVIGVDVGGTKIAAGLLDRDLAVLARRTRATPLEAAPLLDAVAGVVLDLADRAPRGHPVTAVAVGLPTLIERDTGRAAYSTNVDLSDADPRADLTARTGLPVLVDNDANLAALAEHRAGAARGARALVLLTIGTGVGGGVVLDGALMRGGSGTGAELGHITVEADGPPCQRNCPNHGCLETMCSGTALAREGRALVVAAPRGRLARAAREAGEVDARLVVRLAREGDPGCRAILERAGRYIGVGLASLANVFAPDVIVIGGGVGRVGDLLLAPARAEYRARALPPNAEAPVVRARFGADAGLVGAGALALAATAA